MGSLSLSVFTDVPLPMDFEVRLTAFLATLSAHRRRLEELATFPDMTHLGPALARFDDLYRHNKWYRIAWELRNIDQHIPPASRYVALDGESTTSRLPLKVTMPELGIDFDGDKRWSAVERLWDPVPLRVDLREVMDAVMTQHLEIATAVFRLAEDQLVSDLGLLGSLLEEVSGDGELGLYRAMANEREFAFLPMNFSLVRDAVVSIDEVRDLLGEQPLFPSTR